MKKSDNPKRMSMGASIYYTHWLDLETDTFNMWWNTWHGLAEETNADDLETDAADHYYERKAFALAAWLASVVNPPDQANEQTDIEWLINHVAVLGINLRDEADCVDAATESFVALPDHLQEMINEKEAKIDKFNF